MRFFPAEPDISTIFNRIADGDIDLQPDFQRGEVWSTAKQQRLIDSILRGWIVPPILVVAAADGHTQEVLDGQQRLATIRDFKRNELRIDGRIAPFDATISALHGMTYEQLPIDIRRAFDRTTIRIYEVRDYLPDEPAEIFFRLNQPTALTSAEKRNAFYGPVRNQVRELVELFTSSRDIADALGFGNSRMAYDDVVARLAYTLEQGSLQRKVTASAVTDMYRRSEPLSNATFMRIQRSLKRLAAILETISKSGANLPPYLRLNKATALSWLLFLMRQDSNTPAPLLAEFLISFESARSFASNDELRDHWIWATNRMTKTGRQFDGCLLAFNDRASARVADVSSVLIRDLVLWLFWQQVFEPNDKASSFFDRSRKEFDKLAGLVAFNSPDLAEQELLRFIERNDWGGNL